MSSNSLNIRRVLAVALALPLLRRLVLPNTFSRTKTMIASF